LFRALRQRFNPVQVPGRHGLLYILKAGLRAAVCDGRPRSTARRQKPGNRSHPSPTVIDGRGHGSSAGSAAGHIHRNCQRRLHASVGASAWASKVICLVLHRHIYDRCPMDFRQAPRGRVLVAQASTGDLVAGEGGPHETALLAWMRCWPQGDRREPSVRDGRHGAHASWRPRRADPFLPDARPNPEAISIDANSATPEVVALSC
jgi:hypothetical protein